LSGVREGKGRGGIAMDITFYLFFMALLVSFAAWCIFLWAIRTGQFHEVENIKYQVWPEQRNEGQEPGASSQPEAEAGAESARPS
jgi:cbb3-type cytochrome oxidase maturation protein